MSDATTGNLSSVGEHERPHAADTARDRAATVQRPELTWRLGATLVICAAVILGVALAVGFYLKHLGAGGAFGADLSIDRWLVRQRTATLDGWTGIGSNLAQTQTAVGVAIIAFVVLRLWLGRFYESCVLVVALGGELLIFLAAASVVHRPRPPVKRLDLAPPTSSFPSGHTAASVALYGFLAVVIWRYAQHRVLTIAALALLTIPFAVAMSRMYRGMHYPSDVIAGALVGGIWLACVLWVLLPAPRGVSDAGP